MEEGQLVTRTVEKGQVHLDASSGALEESGSNPRTVAAQRKSEFMSFCRRVAQAKAINNHTHWTRIRSTNHWSEERRWHGYTRRGLKVRHERVKVLQPLLLGLPPSLLLRLLGRVPSLQPLHLGLQYFTRNVSTMQRQDICKSNERRIKQD